MLLLQAIARALYLPDAKITDPRILKSRDLTLIVTPDGKDLHVFNKGQGVFGGEIAFMQFEDLKVAIDRLSDEPENTGRYRRVVDLRKLPEVVQEPIRNIEL